MGERERAAVFARFPGAADAQRDTRLVASQHAVASCRACPCLACPYVADAQQAGRACEVWHSNRQHRLAASPSSDNTLCQGCSLQIARFQLTCNTFSLPSKARAATPASNSHCVQALTAAAAINDVGSWALVGWQATFYQRVFDVGPDQYAPALAALLPIGGIIGGVGGGLLADKLSRLGATSWLTSGAAWLCLCAQDQRTGLQSCPSGLSVPALPIPADQRTVPRPSPSMPALPCSVSRSSCLSAQALHGGLQQKAGLWHQLSPAESGPPHYQACL